MNFQQSPSNLSVVAEVLIELSAEIEVLGTALCRDPGFAGTHLKELQAIDLISQKQRTLAILLETGFCERVVDGIGIKELRSRFQP